MAVVIRLARYGAKHRPFYRVVVADKRFARDGRHLEIVGTYNPDGKQKAINLKQDRIQDWLAKGAKPSETVTQLIKRAGS